MHDFSKLTSLLSRDSFLLFRKNCTSCKCPREAHDVCHEEWVSVRSRLGLKGEESSCPATFDPRGKGLAWAPPGLPAHKVGDRFSVRYRFNRPLYQQTIIASLWNSTTVEKLFGRLREKDTIQRRNISNNETLLHDTRERVWRYASAFIYFDLYALCVYACLANFQFSIFSKVQGIN